MYELRSFEPGEMIIEEGSLDDRLFILQTGTIEIRKEGVKIAELEERGTVIGEIGVILNEPRTCGVYATDEVDMLEFNVDLDGIISQNPNLTKRMLVALAQRVQQTTHSLAEANSRILTFQDGSAG